MEIQYQQKLKEFKTSHPKSCKGVKVEDIEKLNTEFPVSYKEFLYLSGDEFEPISGLNLGFYPVDDEQLWIIKQNKNARENLKEYGLEHLMPKHYWVIAEWDGSEVIWYIDLDQGDDPPVYGLNIVEYAEEPDEWWYEKEFNKFSDWVNEAIKEYEEHGHS